MAQSIRISYAPDAYRLLRGVFCIYKPSEVSFNGIKERLITKLCGELNMMKVRPPEKHVEIKDDPLSETGLTVINVPSVSDNPLVVGPRYQIQDFRFQTASRHGFFTSGLCVVGLQSNRKIYEIQHANFLRVYQLTGRLGRATDNFHEEGKTIEKSTYGHVSRYKLDKVLATIQAVNQKLMFNYMGIDINSQVAYDIASQGLIRPAEQSQPLIYGIKCNHFESPNFTIEVQCINENEGFLLSLINEIGLELKTNACCSKIRQTQFGHFNLGHALLKKHWTVEHVINNIINCEKIIPKGSVAPKTPNIVSDPYEISPLQITAK